MRKSRLYIGTSGWSYEHWQKVFYPEGLASGKRLQFYSRQFSTVEINSTFYHTARPSTYLKWKDTVPEEFLFAVKANRYLTHRKRLKDASGPVQRILEGAKLLEDKLGPLLFQLPPSFLFDPVTLEKFLQLLPRDTVNVFEFRSLSWFVPATYELLREYQATFCIFDHPEIECPRQVTSSSVYVRMHGYGAVYGGRYDTATLRRWAGYIRDYLQQGYDVYVYFNNDYGGYAVENACQLRELLREKR